MSIPLQFPFALADRSCNHNHWLKFTKNCIAAVLMICICELQSTLCADEPTFSLGEFLKTNSAVSESEALAIAERFVLYCQSCSRDTKRVLEFSGSTKGIATCQHVSF